jgi:5-formyltetrahydrofolate cyclo-ligase
MALPLKTVPLKTVPNKKIAEEVSVARYKHFLRNHMKAVVLSSPVAKRREVERRLSNRLARWPVFRRARVVGGYRSLPHEVGMAWFFALCQRMKKTVAVPVIHPDRGTLDFCFFNCGRTKEVRNVYGIFEPAPQEREVIDPSHLDLLLLPGRAFTSQGDRLGAGGGYYDRFLKKHPSIPTLGIAYNEQIRPKLPRSPLDKTVDAVLTPGRFYRRP